MTRSAPFRGRFLAASIAIVTGCVGVARAQNASASQDDPPIPTRVQPPAGESRDAVERRAAPRAARERRLRSRRRSERVVVRYLHETPRTIHYGFDLSTFYLPHGAASPLDPYAARWALEAAYLARFEQDRRNLLRLYNFRAASEREARILSRHEQAVRDGVQHLRAGNYRRAVLDLTLAARLNQGDPASRIHLMQARLACGHYLEAARALRRALELQPRLAYLNLRLGSYFPRDGDLPTFVKGLREWIGTNRAPADVHFLLGFLELQRGQYESAYEAFRQADRLRPGDRLTGELLSVSQPVAGHDRK